MSSIAVCIPTCLRPQMVERLLENLTHQTRFPDEILVVDSSPDEETQAVVAAWEKCYTPKTALRRITSARGLTLQRNVGIDNTTCDLICMLDDDVVLEPECLAEMERFLDSSEGQEFGGVSAYITNEYGKDFYGYQRLYHRLGIYEELAPGRWLYCGAFLQLSMLKPFEGVYRSDFVPAGAAIYRRQVLTEIRPDSEFRFGGEDKHLGLRIAQKFPLGVLGTARLRHDHVAGGARRHPFVQGIRSMRNRAVMMVECDPNPTLRRYIAFVSYHWVELNRQTFLSLLNRSEWRNLKRLVGAWVGWWWNLASRPPGNIARPV